MAYTNFKDTVAGLLEKLAGKVDSEGAAGKALTYEDSVTASLDRIAEKFETSSGSLPKVTSINNGKILKVTNGKWAIGVAPIGLPSVSAKDNGKVLKVVDGAWAVVDEE